MRYEKNGDIITITIQDPTYKKTDSWKFNTADAELGAGILRHIQRKYGFSPEVKPSESVNQLEKEKKEVKKPDTDWLDLEVKW